MRRLNIFNFVSKFRAKNMLFFYAGSWHIQKTHVIKVFILNSWHFYLTENNRTISKKCALLDVYVNEKLDLIQVCNNNFIKRDYYNKRKQNSLYNWGNFFLNGFKFHFILYKLKKKIPYWNGNCLEAEGKKEKKQCFV